ncbi:M50 family metallopeptidase [Fictibacillus sp. Mic-4]|uniref:M50 family metallopeptidase n=1 Tax=Fictibacillus sp. Mic-4 TaxID=3132826 RepID=UPI003CFAD083
MNNFFFSYLKKVKINPLFWLVIGLALMTGHFRQMILLFLIVFFHEMGHFMGAHLFQWRIKKVELLPFGGVAEVDEHGNRPFQEEFIITILGPLQHIWMIGVSFLLWHFGVWTNSEHEWFLHMNMTIVCFNLLPIMPLDGGKLLFIFFARYLPFKRAHSLFLIVSFLFLLLFFIVFVSRNPLHLNSWIIFIFLVITHFFEWKQRPYVFMRFLMERIYHASSSSRKEKKLIYVDRNTIVSDVLALFQKGVYHVIIIKEPLRKKEIEEKQLLDVYFASNQVQCAIGRLFR